MRLTKLMMTTFVFAFASGIIGCGSPYVANIAGDKISVQEFEQVYAKNNGGWDAASKTSVEDRQKFLDLYLKFRLKVKDAQAQGYDKDPELRAELAEYRKNLAVSYMLEKEITGPALLRMYDRKLKEVRASHILIRMPETPTPEDTLVSFNYTKLIIDSLKREISFETLARNNSQDPSVQYNNGDLYYFSAGAMVAEFEDAVYSMNPGQFSEVPVRTQFGYHILKVVDVRPNQGAVHAAHIMKRLPPRAGEEDSAKAATELLAARDSIMNGGDFAEFARTISDDTFSGQRGGDLGFIERGRTVREFDEAIFSMKDGEVSNIVRTQFGLHLIKRIEAQGMAPFKDIEQTLKSDYQRYRFQHDYNLMIDKIKKLYSFNIDNDAYKAFEENVDTSKTTNDAAWDSTINAGVRLRTLITFAKEKIAIDSIITLAKMNVELKNLSFKTPVTVQTIVNKLGTNLVTEYHARLMENTFPEFARTMKEYEDGILLFKAEQENVWNKVTPTDAALRLYHDRNRSKYTWSDRINVQEIYVQTDSAAKLVQRSFAGYTVDSLVAKKSKGRTKSKKVQYDTMKIVYAPITFDSAAALYNKRGSTMDKRGVWGLVPVTTNEITNRGWQKHDNDTANYFPADGGFSFIKVLEKDPSREKTFEEAQSEVSGAFQEFETKRIEAEWYEALKKKYPFVVNKEALGVAFSKPQPSQNRQ